MARKLEWFARLFDKAARKGTLKQRAQPTASEKPSIPSLELTSGQTPIHPDAFETELSSAVEKKDFLSPPQADWAVGNFILDDFMIEGTLGVGGMGEVYRVRSESTRRAFAVKTIRSDKLDDESQRAFLNELETWINLPEHPNLAACRFFRTVGNRIIIFAEFVEGGSLASWIREGKLRELEQILDVAIQFAWGLNAVHQLGLVHQDVKPGNVLLTPEGLAKLSDFGLARARAGGEGILDDGSHSVLVSWGGMTPAYCSPEQAQGRALSRRTDVWSWGLSVLEMFTGKRTWNDGQAAPAALQAYLERKDMTSNLPRMPAGVADVLNHCFRIDPNERLASMDMAAEILIRVHDEEVRRAYSRRAPLPKKKSANPAIERERRMGTGVWEDPRIWLVEALKSQGRDPSEANSLLHPRAGTRQAQAIADLAAYEEARRMLNELVRAGRKDLLGRLASLWLDKAVIHNAADDLPGALNCCDESIKICEHLVQTEGSIQAANTLAVAFNNKGIFLNTLGESEAAVAFYDQSIRIRESLIREYPVAEESSYELTKDLAMTNLNKANALFSMGHSDAALRIYDESIRTYERLLGKDGQTETANMLAGAYKSMGALLRSLGDAQSALKLFEQSIKIYERSVYEEGQMELANDLAGTYVNEANALTALGDARVAVGVYDRSLRIREHLVHGEGRWELAKDLARTYLNKGNALVLLGDARGAARAYDPSIKLFERLVHEEGQSELATGLAMAYMNMGNALVNLGDVAGAATVCAQSIKVYERLVREEGRPELEKDLAMAYMNRGNALAMGEDPRAAVTAYDQSIDVYQGLVEREERRELLGDWAHVRLLRAHALSRLGNNGMARREVLEAVSVLNAEIDRTGRADLRQVLNWVNRALRAFL
jgi:serine/threonine protein kinase